MPGTVSHLAEAEIIIHKLVEFDGAETYSEEWKDRFRWGCLAPDAPYQGVCLADRRESIKRKTHFKDAGSQKNIWNSDINVDVFFNKMEKKICLKQENAELFGYYVHLYLDKLFWEVYLKKQIQFLAENGCPTTLANRAVSIKVLRTNRNFPAEKLASILHADYTLMNHYLIEKYDITFPEECCSGGLWKNLELRLDGCEKNPTLHTLLEKQVFYLSETKYKNRNRDVRQTEIIEIDSFERFLKMISDFLPGNRKM